MDHKQTGLVSKFVNQILSLEKLKFTIIQKLNQLIQIIDIGIMIVKAILLFGNSFENGFVYSFKMYWNNLF